MQAPTAGAAAGSSSPSNRRRGRHRRAPLAALPDPYEQDQLQAEADARARAILQSAAGAGAPLLDANGSPRSHVTLPEYRLGRAPGNKGRRYPPEVLTIEELLTLLEQLPKGKSKTGIRNRALIVLLWRTGLRVAEALSLEPRDVDLGLGLIVVRHGKGEKRRAVAIDEKVRRHLQSLFELRVRLGLDSPELRERLELCADEEVPVFCTLSGPGRGRAMHDSTVREMLKLYARKAQIRKRVHPHGLRHTYAFELMREGAPIVYIQELLGHADLETTERYVRHLAPAHLIEWISARACPGEPGEETPTHTAAALSAGGPAPLSQLPSASAPPAAPLSRLRGAAYVTRERGRELEELVLEALRDGKARSTAELAEACGITPPQAVRMLHRMNDRGQVLRAGLGRGHGSYLWRRAPASAVRFTSELPRGRAPKGEPLPRMLDAISALGGRASQARLGRLLELAPGTVQGYCRELEARGVIERDGLDKSTSRRGSQVWRLPQPKAASYGLTGGYTLTLRVPR